jgi:hypothetical protein
MSTIDKFPIPGVSQPGQAGDAAPGSLLAELRKTAAQKRAAATVTVDLSGRWKGKLRARYRTVGLDELERWQDATQLSGSSNLSQSLEILSRACDAIEAYDPETGEWLVLEDDLGPVTFDDRLARLLGWPRPDGEEFTFPVRTVYETMFDGNGMALGVHVGLVADFMGLTEEEIVAGEASTGRTSTPSAPPSPSA